MSTEQLDSTNKSTDIHEFILSRLRDLQEVELHKRIVIPLLRKMGATHISYVHGAFERGKDHVYLTLDFYGNQQLVVCQVKNEKFTGRANSSTSIVGALNQLLQCREVEVLNPLTNMKELPQEVVLFTTYAFPDSPLADATPLLSKVRSLTKIVGPDTIPALVRRFLPEVYETWVFPGENLARQVRRYVIQHHEAAAFDLTRTHDIGHFFVNLGMAPSGLLSRLLTETAGKRSEASRQRLGTCLIPTQVYLAAKAVNETLPSAIQPFVKVKQRTKHCFVESQVAEVDSADPTFWASHNPEIEDQSLGRTAIAQPDFASFLSEIERYVSVVQRAVDDLGPASEARWLSAEALDCLDACDRLARQVSAATEETERDLEEVEDLDAQVPGRRLGLRQIDPGAILSTRSDTCIVGEAGAGKTCFARVLAQKAIEEGVSCVYFPCARIRRHDATLGTELLEFLRSIDAIRASHSLEDVLNSVELFVLDGCDEAASFGDSLGREMADLFFRGPYAAAVPRVGHKEPWIPADLEEAVRFTSGRTGTSGEIAFQRSVNSVDVIRLLAGNQGTSFEVSLGTAVHDMLSKSPRVVITTRTVAPLNLPSSFQVFRLLPFDDDQLSEFFEKSCSDTQQGAEDILQFLDKHLHVKDICRTPMVATIVSALHQNGYDLPRSRTEIYEKRFDLLMERWDRARGVANRCSVSATDKLRFLIRVAVKLHQEHRRRFSRAEGKAVWSQGFSRLYPNLDFDTVLAEMQFVNYIIYGEGGDEYSLGHLSYQEFLAAKGFLLGQRGRSLAKYVNDRWWHNVFVFYAGISGDIGPLLESIARQRDLDEIGSLLDEMIDEARYTSSLVRSVLSGFREERFGDDEDDEDDFAR